MNPSGLRLEEKKCADENRSQISYKSTQSSRSSVLQRARAYNRRFDEQKQSETKRTKSLERRSDDGSSVLDSSPPRSKSTGRTTQQVQSANSALTKHQSRSKALESVRRDSRLRSINHDPSTRQSIDVHQMQGHPPMPTTSGNRFGHENVVRSPGPDTIAPQHQQTLQSNQRQSLSSESSPDQQTRPLRLIAKETIEEVQENPIITPELLVEALSGTEDGLLQIAEKLMEHYDSGYDVMGEAIIDAFADVQKLFQHVVEAAHMEGAAFEASRRENERTERKRDSFGKDEGNSSPNDPPMGLAPSTPQGGPSRHDEFIDQDVQDILQDAIKKGNVLRDANRHTECFELFESSCQAASSLLPVDSDHRGRLQLSLARAESMSHDRACAILRYAMDDVLRSSSRAAKTPLFDPSKRADVVLSRPVVHPSITASRQPSGVVQSSDEALASLMEEMKEILSAPVYNDTPLQAVAGRFWAALNDAQKMQQKTEERLEHNLGKLKGEFLLARAEWEEKLNQSTEMADSWKERYERLKEMRRADGYMDQARSFASRMSENVGQEDQAPEAPSLFGSVKNYTTPGKAASVASFSSGLAQQAKTLVSQMNSFNCSNMNDRTGTAVSSELESEMKQELEISHSKSSQQRSTRDFSPQRSADI